MKKVSFVNPNFQQGPKELNAYYLPYSAGILWSYVYQFDDIKQDYELDSFIWNRIPINKAIEQLKNSDIIGFSTYIWNKNYNNELARQIKNKFPEKLIIFGGPEPPIENKTFFKQFPYIDIVVKQEGEKSFLNILRSKTSNELLHAPGLLINSNLETIDTGQSERLGEEELSKVPSPYLTGVFDNIMNKFSNITWNVTLETNRGCPYACTFCDWGSLTYNKIKKFDLNRVFDELEWVGKNKCDFVSITDANFGILVERDNLIADKLIEVQKKYGFPKSYTISWAKNQKKEIIGIVKKLIFDGGSKVGLNLSVQTMDENVLDVIKRKNLEQHKIKEIFELCEGNNIPLYTELILGLPGETLESWKNNFYELYKAGNHTGITIYQAQLLENAEMNLLQKKLYKIKGKTVYDYLVGTYNENEVKEGIEVVISTKDLIDDDMIRAQIFGWFMNTFHINGLTNFLSRFFYKFLNISYEEFYEKFFDYIHTDDWLLSEIDRITHHYQNWRSFGKIDHAPIQGIEIHGWNLIHSTIINLHSSNKLFHLQTIIESFILKEFVIDERILNDLLTLQRNYLVNWNEITLFPKNIKLQHDVYGYILYDTELLNSASLIFEFPEDKTMSLEKFCEQIFFARRRNFGKSWIKYE